MIFAMSTRSPYLPRPCGHVPAPQVVFSSIKDHRSSEFECKKSEELKNAQIHRCMERTSSHRTQFQQQ